MAKCVKCLKGAKVSTTGVSPKNATLRLDIGSAVLYVTPKSDGSIDVALNSENLLDGDFKYCIWNGKQWII